MKRCVEASGGRPFHNFGAKFEFWRETVWGHISVAWVFIHTLTLSSLLTGLSTLLVCHSCTGLMPLLLPLLHVLLHLWSVHLSTGAGVAV